MKNINTKVGRILLIGIVVVVVVGIAYTSVSNSINEDASDFENGPMDHLVGPVQSDLSDDANLSLPDLQIGEMADLYIRRDPERDIREIRFDTTVINTGEGALDLTGIYNEESNSVIVTQKIFTKDDNTVEELAGSFVYHEGHEHWHFENFSLFELYTYTEDGSLDELVASTDKMSFCLFDERRIDPPLPGSPETSVYQQCDNEEVQGISSGWSDTYRSTIEGQQLDIEDISDGSYAIKATIDPLHNIVEKDKENNSYIVYVEIEGLDIRVVSQG